MEKKSGYNYGIALGRLLMCFEVVLSHFGGEGRPSMMRPFGMLPHTSIVFFVFVAFYLGERTFRQRSAEKLKMRLWKLFYVQLAWAVIYWLAHTALEFLSTRDPRVCLTELPLLFWQILTGHSPKLNSTMWFQTDLIVMTALVGLLFWCLSDKKALTAAALLGAGCLLLQYSGANWALFSGLRYELKYPLGRLAEVIPMAALGLLAVRFDLPGRMGKAAPLFCLGGIAVTLLLKIPAPQGFDCEGLSLLLYGTFFTMMAISLPLRSLPEGAKGVIRTATRFTMGIYCMHKLMGNLLQLVFDRVGLASTGALFCAAIYVCCWLCCLVLSKLPWKWARYLAE